MNSKKLINSELCEVSDSESQVYKVNDDNNAISTNSSQVPDNSNKLNKESDVIASESITVTSNLKFKSETCSVCECKFDPKLQDHSVNRQMYKCGLCKKTFGNAKQLKTHFNAHLNAYPFMCNICYMGFQCNSNLNIHKRNIHATETSNEVEHEEEKKRFQCKHCSKRFMTRSNQYSHQRTHSEARKYPCDVCTRSFKTNFELKSHYLIHTDTKPFICKICNKGFRQQGNLSAHKRIHRGEKPFKCNVCGNSFRENSKLRRHYRIHENSLPYSCPECGRMFRDLSNMKKHQQTHFKKSSLRMVKSRVNQDEEETTTEETLESDTYICNICGDAFLEVNLAQEHVKSHHKDDAEQESLIYSGENSREEEEELVNFEDDALNNDQYIEEEDIDY